MLCIPMPQNEESPKSLLSRYSEKNFFSNVSLALNVRSEDAGSNPRFLFGGLKEVKKFASGVESSLNLDLDKWFYGQAAGFTDDSPVIWNGCEIPRAFFVSGKARLCPCCIKGEIIHQSADFSFFSSCPVHQVKLHESCPNCKKPISWNRGSIQCCQTCNFQFKALAEVPMHRPAEGTLMEWVRSGDATAVSQCLKFLKALRGFYTKEIFHAGVLLEVAVKLHQGDTADLLEFLSVLYPAGTLTNRLILAPLILACGDSMEEIKQRLEPLLAGIQNQSRSLQPTATLNKTTLRLEEVEFALNITAQTRRKLTANEFLKEVQDNASRKQVDTKSLLDFFEIVEKAKIPSVEPAIERWERLSLKLVNNMTLLKQGKASVTEHNWAAGCSGFWIKPEVSKHEVPADGYEVPADGLLTFDEFAQVAQTYSDAIRRVVKAGLVLPDVEKKGKTGAKFSVKTVDSFCKQYCFSSEIAKSVKQGSTILGAVLSGAGVEPVSGPKVDGALVPLYRRSDLDGLDVLSLVERKEFKSNAGRKKEGTVLYDRDTWMSSKEISALFEFSPVELSSAVAQGHLKVGVPLGRESDNCRYYLRESVLAFKEKLQTSILVDDAYVQLGISKAEFYKRFVASEFVRLIIIGKHSWIMRDDYLRVEEDCRLYIGTETATRLTGAPPRHFRNLINTDRISKVSSKETITAGFLDLIRRRDLSIHAVMAPGYRLKSGPEDEANHLVSK
jgi:hypothetical protein